MIEILLNTGTGFIAAALFQQYVITPMFNTQTSVSENLTITVLFTVLSLVRSYFWRRLFNRFLKKA